MEKKKNYQIAVLGSSNKGNYGHHLDIAFQGFKNVQITAIGDENKEGLIQKGRELKCVNLYTNFEELYSKHEIDITCVCPGWVTDRVTMIKTAANHGSSIYCEKPLAGTLLEVDQIVETCERNNVRLAMAHQWRAMPAIETTIENLKLGKFGRVLRITARPKDDSRGGGEEFLLHGSHLFDIMIEILGKPCWVSSSITKNGKNAQYEDKTTGTQPVGPILGDTIYAIIGFGEGALGLFISTANLVGEKNPRLDGLGVYGLTIETEQKVILMREPGEVYIYPLPTILPDYDDICWERELVQPWHSEEGKSIKKLKENNSWIKHGNKILANDLIESMEKEYEPRSTLRKVKYINEIVQGAYWSHLANGKRITIPLTNRNHPLF